MSGKDAPVLSMFRAGAARRTCTDALGKEVFLVQSTYRQGGMVTPCQADIMAVVFAAFVESESFKDAYAEALRLREHFAEPQDVHVCLRQFMEGRMWGKR